MKYLLILLLLSGLVGCTPGCANGTILGIPFGQANDTDIDKVSKMESSYNSIMRILIAAQINGWLPPEVSDQIELARSAINKSLDKLKVDVTSGTKLESSTYYRAVEAGLNELTLYSTRYQDAPAGNGGSVGSNSGSHDAGGNPGGSGSTRSPVDPGATPAD